MTQTPKWFDRKFEFTFPVDLYPNLCVRLRGTPARLEEMVRTFSSERLVRQPAEKWTAQEADGHLLVNEDLLMARDENYLPKGDQLVAAELNHRKTNEANHSARRVDDIITYFRKQRLQLVERVAG